MMLTNGILDSSSSMPLERWDCPDVDPEMVKMFLCERIRFPYASNLTVQNRIMKNAMSEQLATYDKDDMMKSGIPTRELIHLYEKFADGGFGIIVTGSIMINGRDIEAPGNVIIDRQLDSEERRNALKEWTQCAKRNRSIIIAQLFHPGKHAADLPHKTNFDINKLTRNQIGDLINEYAYAASYAQQCGFDGVEISCTYFFALGDLITSGRNNRNDDFGGTLNDRAKILYKIIQAIRMKIYKPSYFAIGLQLFYGNFEPGYNSDDFGEFVRNVEKTGFDYITITGGSYDLIKDLKRGDDPKECAYFYQKFVLAMRKHLTRTKLFMNGGFVTLTEMIAAIRDGWVAGISLARPVAAEPDLPKRLFAGEVKSAAKSLFPSTDHLIERKFAGTQLWQHACSLPVMDASNPNHIEQFKKDLHLHEKQQLIDSNNDASEMIIGYPKTILHPESLDNDIIEHIQQLTRETEAVTSDEQQKENELTSAKIDFDTEKMMIEEEEAHYVIKKTLDYGLTGDLEENIVENSIHTVIKRHENTAGTDVDIFQETVEKVIVTKSDFSELSKPEGDESLNQAQTSTDAMEMQPNDGIISQSYGTDVLNTTPEAQNFGSIDAGKVDEEVIKTVTEEGLREEDDEIDTTAIDIEEPCKKILYPTEQSGNIGITEVISGLSDGDKPIISGIVEEVRDDGDDVDDITEVISGLSDGNKPIISGIVEEVRDDDDAVKSMEYNQEQRDMEKLISENVRKLVCDDREPFENDVVEEVSDKEKFDVPTEMVTSFMQDSLMKQDKLSPGTDDEDTTKFHDMEENQEIGKEVHDFSEDNKVKVGDTVESTQDDYIPTNVIDDYIPESVEEHFLEMTSKSADSQSEATQSKDLVADDPVQEYFSADETKKEEQFLEGKFDQSQWTEQSGEADHYSISPPKYDATLLTSTSPSGNSESIAYDEQHYDKHSSPVQAYGETYEIPGDDTKVVKSDENLPIEKIDIIKLEPELNAGKCETDSSSKEKLKHGLAGFISSALPDSVQSLISSTKMKFDEMLGEDDRKHQPDVQFTMQTQEMIGDDGNKYEIHTESYTVSSTDHKLSPDLSNTKAFLDDNSDKFVTHDDNATTESTGTYYATETTITKVTSSDEMESSSHTNGLFSSKKSTDEHDFEFIH